MDNYIIKLDDGGLVDIMTGQQYNPGCPTCDYGSDYIDNITMYFSKYKFSLETHKMYDYAMNTATIIKIIANRPKVLTERMFIDYFIDSLKEISSSSYSEFKFEWKLYDINYIDCLICSGCYPEVK